MCATKGKEDFEKYRKEYKEYLIEIRENPKDNRIKKNASIDTHVSDTKFTILHPEVGVNFWQCIKNKDLPPDAQSKIEKYLKPTYKHPENVHNNAKSYIQNMRFFIEFLEKKHPEYFTSGYDSQIKIEDSPKGNNKKNSIQGLEFINKALMIILPVLSKYIGRILLKRNENNWWKKYVLDKLRETRDLPQNGSKEEYINELDISACINIIIQNWDEIFKHEMDIHSRDLAFSLLGIRNKEGAHYTKKILETYSYKDVDYALGTMIHFVHPIDTNVANQISEIKREFENKYKNEN
jgi:hypothetical protein